MQHTVHSNDTILHAVFLLYLYVMGLYPNPPKAFDYYDDLSQI